MKTTAPAIKKIFTAETERKKRLQRESSSAVSVVNTNLLIVSVLE